MRFRCRLSTLLLVAAWVTHPAQAQVPDAPERPPDATPEVGTEPEAPSPLHVGRESAMTDVEVPPTQDRRAMAPRRVAGAEALERAANPPRPQFEVSQVELPNVTEEELTRAAYVLLRANAAYAAQRDAIMQATLAGDEGRYRTLHQQIDAEIEAALAEIDTERETYERVLDALPKSPALNARFFAALGEVRERG